MKRMTINDVEFEVMKKGSISFCSDYMCRTLDDCYAKPSDIKKAIWKEWCDFFRPFYLNFAKGVFVNSYNRMIFTIGAQILYNGVMYNILITPTHNYISEI